MTTPASLDFVDTEGEIFGQHYAFPASEEEFDLIRGRLGDDGRQWWTDPFQGQPHEINPEGGGRGLYWEGPTGTGWSSLHVRSAAAGDVRDRCMGLPAGPPQTQGDER